MQDGQADTQWSYYLGAARVGLVRGKYPYSVEEVDFVANKMGMSKSLTGSPPGFIVVSRLPVGSTIAACELTRRDLG